MNPRPFRFGRKISFPYTDIDKHTCSFLISFEEYFLINPSCWVSLQKASASVFSMATDVHNYNIECTYYKIFQIWIWGKVSVGV